MADFVVSATSCSHSESVLVTIAHILISHDVVQNSEIVTETCVMMINTLLYSSIASEVIRRKDLSDP